MIPDQDLKIKRLQVPRNVTKKVNIIIESFYQCFRFYYLELSGDLARFSVYFMGFSALLYDRGQ